MIELNEEICEFIGAFIGDGYMSLMGKKNYVVGVSGNKVLDEDYLKNRLIPIVKKYFPKSNPHLRYRTDENTIVLLIYSKELCHFLMELGFNFGPKSRTVTIPSLIICKENLMNATTRGIFDTDGCFFIDKRKNYKKPYPRITLQVASIPLIEQLETYLSKNFSLYVDKSNRDGKRNTLEIYGYQQLERFLKQIGFSNKRHMSKIMPLWLSSYSARF